MFMGAGFMAPLIGGFMVAIFMVKAVRVGRERGGRVGGKWLQSWEWYVNKWLAITAGVASSLWSDLGALNRLGTVLCTV